MLRDAIKQRLKDLDVTQKQMADYLGCFGQNLSQFLNGVRAIPMETLERLLEAIGMTVGRKSECVGTIPPADMIEAVRTAFTESGKRKIELARESGVNYCTLVSLLGGKRRLNVTQTARLMKALGLKLVPYGVPKIYERNEE